MYEEKRFVQTLENFLTDKLDYNNVLLMKSSTLEKFKHLSESVIYRIKNHENLSHIGGLFYEIFDSNLQIKLGYVRLRQWECKEEINERPVHTGAKIKLDSMVCVNNKLYDGLIISYLNSSPAPGNICAQEEFMTRNSERKYIRTEKIEGLLCIDFLNFALNNAIKN
jgi:hypothetical protein